MNKIYKNMNQSTENVMTNGTAFFIQTTFELSSFVHFFSYHFYNINFDYFSLDLLSITHGIYENSNDK